MRILFSQFSRVEIFHFTQHTHDKIPVNKANYVGGSKKGFYLLLLYKNFEYKKNTFVE